jgi:ceramide glucosyltransferase
VSVLKPLHGTEPGMEQNLETFFEQDYPEFELLFCARQETMRGCSWRGGAARYPQVDAKFVTCGEPMPKFHNAKVYSLAKLDSVAKNDCCTYERCGCAGGAGLSAAHGAEPEGPA